MTEPINGHETFVNVTINMPETMLHKIDAAIKAEREETGVRLFRGQFICRAVSEALKKAGGDA